MAEDTAWFEASRVNIAKQYPGQYVVVKNQAIVGAYPDYQSAYNAGTAMFGTEPFLVKFAEAKPFVEKGYYVGGRSFRRPFRTLGQTDVLPAPQLSPVEKLRRDGALLQVQVAIPAALAQQMKANGQTVPPPQTAVGMIDTGASISTISEAIASAAGLQTTGSVPISGVGGTSERPVMSASIGLPEYNVTVDPIEIVAVSINAPGFEILIGRDILQALELKYTGSHGIFSLTQDAENVPGAAVAAPSGLGTGTWVALGVLGAGALGAGLWAADVF